MEMLESVVRARDMSWGHGWMVGGGSVKDVDVRDVGRRSDVLGVDGVPPRV